MDFFPQRPPVSPKIYAYELIGVASHRGYIKVGYTERDVDTRIREQTHTVAVPYRVLETWPAMRSDGSCFTDKDLHAVLRRKGFRQLNEGEDRNEWFRCTVNDVKAAVYAVRNRTENVENRTNDFFMRPEQKEAVDKTEAYFRSAAAEGYPKFLWNCKMRFGKTFAAYQAAVEVFKTRRIAKTYAAIVVGSFPYAHQKIDAPLDDQPAVSLVTREAAGPDASFLRVRIETGRTNQIRRHLSSIRFPILGDRTFGLKTARDPKLMAVPRQMLHAAELQLPDPMRGGKGQIKAHSPLPADFRQCLKAFGMGK